MYIWLVGVGDTENIGINLIQSKYKASIADTFDILYIYDKCAQYNDRPSVV